MMTKPTPRIDYTNTDYESIRAALLALARERLPEWTDHSPNDLGVVLVELFAAMGDTLFYYLDRVANESYLETAQERRSVVHLLRLIGYELRPRLPASAALTLLFDEAAAGTVQIPRGAAFATSAKATGVSIGFQYLRPSLTIDRDVLPTVSVGDKTYKFFSPLPVVQVDHAVAGEVIGSSSGQANQRFALASAPLIDGTLTLSVLQPTMKAWERVDSLLESGPGSEHYAVRRDADDVAWIEFGDGHSGKAPVRGRNNLIASYAVGGGARGNVPAYAIAEIKTPIADLVKVYNEAPGSGGTEREPVAEAVMRGPQKFRSMGRAVTASDFEAHARSLGIAKVRAQGAGNRVRLWIAPGGGGYATDTLKDDLRAYFEDKRMVTTSVEIIDPIYVAIRATATLQVAPHYFRQDVEVRARAAARAVWSFERVDFGETLYVSKIYEAIEAVEGVAGVTVTSFYREGGEVGSEGSLKLAYGELPLWSGFNGLAVSGGKSHV